MAEFLRRHSLMLTSLALIVCSFQLMSLSISNRRIPQVGAKMVDSVIVPIQKGYFEIFQSGKYLWNRYLWLISVESEREDLLERVEGLEAQNTRLAEYGKENERLRGLLNFTERSGYVGVVASVIGRDASNWVKSITIDRGEADGIRPGLAVVDGKAIVGQTIAVSKHSARVLLLTDNSSAVDALAQTSRAVGTAEGGLGRSSLRLRYVLKLKEFQVSVGDRVLASGLDGVFPKGALIGVVSKAESPATGLFQDIEVEPSVDVYRLENLLVIVPEKSSPDAELESALADTIAESRAEKKDG